VQEATIISIRIPKEVKTRMRELGIKPSEAAREGIVMVIRRKELLNLEKRARGFKGNFGKMSDKEIVETIREARDSR
jgi:hypothetical protein